MVQDQQAGFFTRAWRLYADGFSNLSRLAKVLWLIIAIKLIMMFAVLRPFFFPNHTKQQANERGISGSEWVQQDLIERALKDSTSMD